MKYAAISCLLFAWSVSRAFVESSQTIAPQIVEGSSAHLHLKAFLWKPPGPGTFPVVLFNHGSGGVDAAHIAGMQITEAAERLAPLFLKHGYAFLYLFRRDQGLSADQTPFMQGVLQREDQLEDVTAALPFLKAAPGIDATRIALAGHSFGGQLTLLARERERTARAVITFGLTADSWQRSPELRECLLTAFRNTTAPVMLIHAANDYDTTPGRALSAELHRLHKPHVLKICPPVGQTSDDGHNLLYLAIAQWEDDVFGFLDNYIKP